MTVTTPSAPLLDEQICFALYSASRALTARYRDVLAPFDITYPQYLVLMVLWETGTTSVTGLGRRLQLDSGTLSPLLRRLEAAELITRSRLASDERSVEVCLTPRGDKLRSAAALIPDLICATTGLSTTELATLKAQLSELAHHVRESD